MIGPLVLAAGTATNVALPVSEASAVVRLQVRYDGSPVFPLAVAYGVTPELTAMVEAPLSFGGIGDSPLVVRWTALAGDAPGLTSRLGLIGGVRLPFRSGAFDAIAGAVYTFQTLRFELDADLVVMPLSLAGLADVSLQIRVWPWSDPDLRDFELMAVGELNGRWAGGPQLYATPGLQLIGRGVIFEAAVQLPVVAPAATAPALLAGVRFYL